MLALRTFVRNVSFVTLSALAASPAAAQEPCFTFIQISDPQAITSADFARFQLVLDTVVAAGSPGALVPRAPDVVIFPGDFVDDDRVLDQWTQTRDMIAASLTANDIPYFAIAGNHDQEQAGIARYEEFIADSGVFDFESAWFTGHNGRSGATGWRGLRFIGVNTSNGAWNTVSAADLADVDARVVAATAAGENVVIMGHHEHNGEGRVPLLTPLSRPAVIAYVRGHANQPFVTPGLVGIANPNVWELNSNSIIDVGALLYYEVFTDRIQAYVLRLAFGPTSLPTPATIWLQQPLTPAVPSSPVAGFEATPLSGDAPLTIEFTDTSSGPATQWSWNFGDGETSTLKNPVHTYTAPGIYTVRLQVTNVAGSSSLLRTDLVTVSAPPPIRTFRATEDTQIKSTSPTRNYGTEPELRVRSGDVVYDSYLRFAVTGIAAAPIVSAKVRLRVTDGSDVGGALYAVNAPWTELGLTAANAPTWSGAPLRSLGAVTAGTWAEWDITPFVTGNGVYSFGLRSSSTNSAIYASRETAFAPELVVEVGPPIAPLASFTATPVSGLAPLTVRFTDTSSNFPTSWEWDFGDGSTSTSQNPVHTYGDAGSYSVTLRAANEAGSNVRTEVGLVTVAPAVVPTASFTATPVSGRAPLLVTFTDSSAGNPTGWSWDFGNGNVSSLQSPTHTYTAAGTYTVTLLVSSGAGSDVLVRSALITVQPPFTTSVFPAVADARVKSTGPSSNYGSSDYLQVRSGAPSYASYLRFTVTGLAGQSVQSAKLRLLVTDGSGDAGTVYRTVGAWTESTLTYTNRPALSGGALGSIGSVNAGNWVEVDVTSVVQANGTYDFAIAGGSTNSAEFSSREGFGAPELVVRTLPSVSISVEPVSADAYVKSSNLNTNYGGDDHVRVRNGSPRFASYLRFDVSSVAGRPVDSARLRLFVVDGSPDAGSLYLTSASWSEGTLTFGNAPTLGAPVRALGAAVAGTWLEADVTSFVTGDGPLSFGLDNTSTDSALFSSREGAYAPELVLALRN